MSEKAEIVCKVSKWFWWRLFIILAITAVLGALFLKDWKYGYPEKNYQKTMYESFQTTRDLFTEHLKFKKSAQEWSALVSQTSLTYPENTLILPVENRNETLPELLHDYDAYYEVYENGDYKNRKHPPLWKEYSAEQKWDEEPPKAYKDKSKIDEQLYCAIGTGVLSCLLILVMLVMRTRSMRVTETAFFPPNGKKIPFTEMTKIDKRKWDTKGLATIYYSHCSETKKARVDGMVYGQFSEKQDMPAERLFQKILANFKGELVELVEEEPTEE